MTNNLKICILIAAISVYSLQYQILFAQVSNDSEVNFPSEGAIYEADWGTYLLGNNIHEFRNLRFGVSNDGYTRAEIRLENNNTSHGHIYFRTNQTSGGALTRMIIRSNGNIGIGTTNPQAKLAVNGNILAKEIKINTDISVPDYVFESDYELTPLKEIESYIKSHKHLPEIPSAVDIARDGLDLTEMNLLLLKKVEELTLYLIQLHDENTDFKQRIGHLENTIIQIKHPTNGIKDEIEK